MEDITETQTQTKDSMPKQEKKKSEFDWKKWTLYNPETHKLSAAEQINPYLSILKIKTSSDSAARKLEEGDTATFHFIAHYNRDDSSTDYASWGDKGKSIRWAVGKGNLVAALEELLLRMLPGERMLGWAAPEVAYGVAGSLGGKHILFEVELASITYKKIALDDRDLTDADRLAEARRARATGRSKLEEKPVAHKAAMKEFNRALQLLDQVILDEDDDSDEKLRFAEAVAEEKFFLHLNDAYVYMLRSRMGVASEWRKAVEHARAAVEIQSEPDAPESVRRNAKAQYRLGCAYLGMGDVLMARIAAQSAAEMAPGDKAVAKLVADVEARQRELDKTSPFLGMFNRK